VGSIGDASLAAALPAIVEAELLKDDRIARVVVRVSYHVDAGVVSFLIDIRAVPADDTEDFGFTLRATEVSVSVVGGVS